MKQNTIINKGNYSFEPLEREELFSKYKGIGWEKEYKEYRKNWEEYPKKQFVSKYPLLVDIELASLCNLKCPMCYTITKEFKKMVNAKFMDFELFKKIIDEIYNDVPAIRLSLRGESTLHPKFIECIQYAKDKGIKEISFLTNGSKLDRENFIKIMKVGATWITISFDGLREEYEKIRKPLKYEDTLNKIKEIKKIKDEFNSKQPVIKIQSIWTSIRNNPEEFYNTFEPYVDSIAFNPLINFHKKPENKSFIDNFYCPMLYQRLVIGADGLVMLCANDEQNTHIVGDINKETVYNIWHGEKLNSVRELHKKPCGYKELEVCKKCYLPVATEDGERAIINGREIIVRNYVYKE
ncbi:radical SAM protein [Aliarcobacter cryaerophilus]|uniref:radical SAM/SPASM domain-containing protein n=1 Tax=Aliarcobacter cryaerophilus TaxID=28198 RepID=UPI0021B240C3|nr:radical SAM protein [Aliarcobacter cryaerophilus]MCT7522602.1 radical SAM protein [Aliarcobacter cryaerophilus]